jgi:multicomponent Na+:H+ antiporter subunit C
VPIWDAALPDAADYVNPIPHGLMLTAIVVSVATTGVGLALLIRIHRNFGTLDEDALLDAMRRRRDS